MSGSSVHSDTSDTARPKPSKVALVWENRALVLAAARTWLSFQLIGPARPSWSLEVAILTAVAQASSQQTPKREPSLKALRELLSFDKRAPPPASAIYARVKVPLRSRELKGVLAEHDAQASGEIEAEWTLHRSVWPAAGGGKAGDRVVLYLHGGAYVR